MLERTMAYVSIMMKNRVILTVKLKSHLAIGWLKKTEKRMLELPSMKAMDIEKHMYMAVAPDPDIWIRTSAEARLSNFLLW
ncbi:Decaprenyl diphosphate synthase-like [Sesbania bispinosa]|nr:Decaprenyl diphosphate synthase-like [Sesbania bispinosa]